jgi:tetratricopeptide repeat protein
MRILRFAAYLWPGLARLWFEGAWSGLALAFGFGLAINFLTLTSFVWVDLVGTNLLWLGWATTGVVWAGSGLFLGWRGGLRDKTGEAAARDDLFRRGLGEYLKGAWFEAESLFGQLVARDPRDVDARLTLATLFRHTGRPGEAQRQLDELDRLEKAEKWRAEIDRERLLLKALAEAPLEPRSRSNPLPDGAAQAA